MRAEGRPGNTPDTSPSAGWVGLLRSCSAHEAYLRTYRSAVEAERVVEFLVLDRLFPRSVYASLVQAERCLAELDPTAGRTGVDDRARRLLGRARTDLELRVSDDLLEDLPGLLDGLQRTCSEVATPSVGATSTTRRRVVVRGVGPVTASVPGTTTEEVSR